MSSTNNPLAGGEKSAPHGASLTALVSREYMCDDFCFSCAYFKQVKGHFGTCLDRNDGCVYDGTRKGSACPLWRVKSSWAGIGFELQEGPQIHVVQNIPVNSWRPSLGSALSRQEYAYIFKSVKPSAEKIEHVIDRIKVRKQEEKRKRTSSLIKASNHAMRLVRFMMPLHPPNRIIGPLSFIDEWLRVEGRGKGEAVHSAVAMHSLGYEIDEIGSMLKRSSACILSWLDSYSNYVRVKGFDYPRDRWVMPFLKQQGQRFLYGGVVEQSTLLKKESHILGICKRCGGQTVKNGKKRGKQQYVCKACDRQQVEYESGFRGMKYEPKIIATALDLHFKGISVREISDHLKLTNGLGVNFTTVYRWIGKYAELLSICPRCSSSSIIKHGIRRNKNGDIQRFTCKDCGKRFVRNLGFERVKAKPQIVTKALQLYFTGESLRNVRNFLALQGVTVSHQTIHNWIRRYVKLMDKYLEQIKPQVSDTWRADELYVKMKGNMNYLFALMDDETRFWIAQEVADGKDNHDARRLFLGKSVDGKKPDTPILKGYQIFHNCLRPHEGLEGRN